MMIRSTEAWAGALLFLICRHLGLPYTKLDMLARFDTNETEMSSAISRSMRLFYDKLPVSDQYDLNLLHRYGDELRLLRVRERARVRALARQLLLVR